VGGVIKNSNGTAAAPSYTFTNDTDTGFYSASANNIGVAANGAMISYLTAATNYTDSFFYSPRFITPATTNYPMTLTGRINDGASAVGVILDNSTTLSVAGAKIVSFKNNTTEKAAIGLGGEVMAGLGTVSLPGLTFLGDSDTGIYSIGANQIGFTTAGVGRGYIGSAGILFDSLYSNNAVTVTLKGTVADGATAVGTTIGSYNTLSTAGAKIASFVNNTTEKAYISKDGTFGSVLGAVTLAAAATTFAAAGNVMTITGDAGGNTIATITAGVTGQTLILKFVDALVTITDTAAATANTINLSAAFTSTADDTMTLMFDGNKWFETSRSIN
ncbi:hypothetical protein HZB93_02055, partial [Candidatus Falkowbacteria bacterium]|nr:hypothetical protein [Candidatus Falkowbacteria bacterium]